ncbi:oxygenase MpaB family protein [Saccharopolyspora pogona]|uniref:oxygenase MpaB family protein n=1 Tax=Saccharopolyspora pogona TaxID=333966 RepID=UPI001CC22ACC|nr:oxygenase MpaB family protein [Saccharopolyspora pogona]
MTAPLWTDDLLDRMRGLGDPLADAAIAETYDLGQQDQVRQALLGLERNNDPLPTGLPPQVQRYFEEAALPEWADTTLMSRGRTLLGRYENSLVSTLLCYSLVACYSCGDGAQVLGMSQRLTSGVYRRLMETSQFLVDVLDKDGLGAGGKGLRSAQKIRLLHATMRYHLSQRKDWDSAWGIPVNQEDLAGTLMSFSVVIPRGLERLGIDLAEEDRDAFFHIWRVIGHVLGVDAQLNAAGFDDGSALSDTILRRQQSTSEAGIALTKGVLDFIREILPGPALAGVGPTLIRHLAGDQTADLVAVPPADFSQLAVGVGSALNFGYGETSNTVPLAAKAADELGTVVFKAGLRLTNKGRRYNWEVPTGLTQAN